MRVRIPGWSRGSVLPSDLYRYQDERAESWSLRVNGQPVASTLHEGYAVLERSWKPGDVVELDLPMPVRRVLANEQIKFDRGRVAVERGPLVYCVEGADHEGHVLDLWLPDDAELQPARRDDLLGGVTVLTGTAQSVSAWRGWRSAKSGQGDHDDSLLRLVPSRGERDGRLDPAIGGARQGAPGADDRFPPAASRLRMCAHDSAAALNDQLLPQSSSDHEVPRFTWWDHRGTREWVQYEFAEPATVSEVDVYWFDDTGRGQCRVPDSWTLLYQDGDHWVPVPTDKPGGVARDRFNRLTFTPVTTRGLRIQVQLQPEFSGGILEWTVK